MRCLVLYFSWGLNNGPGSFTYCFDALRDSLKAKGKEKEFLKVLLTPKCFFQHLPFLLYPFRFLGSVRACLVLATRCFYGVRFRNVCKVNLVRCIKHDKDKLEVLKLLSLAHEVQDQSWIWKGPRVSDHAFYNCKRVRPCVHQITK